MFGGRLKGSGTKGFSLVELLTALTVIGIAASIAAPRLDFARHVVNSAASSVSALLLRAQREAVQEQHPVVVAFDVEEGQLRIHSDTNGNLLIDAGEPVRYETLGEGVRLSRGHAEPMFATSQAVTFSLMQDGLRAVAFQRNGSVSEEGGFYLTSVRGTESDAHAGDARAVSVQRSTGRLRWFVYRNTGWKEKS